MPSARLVFNDDATVLGPVLERTGEMIKAATSDIPRLRFAQEGLALDRERFGHTKAMDTANLQMRQDALQAQQDAALTGTLFGPGAAGAGGARSTGLTSTRGLAGAASAQGRLDLAGEKQDSAAYGQAYKRVQDAIEAELKAIPDYRIGKDANEIDTKLPLSEQELAARMAKARHQAGLRLSPEQDADPIVAQVMHDMGFSVNSPASRSRGDPDGQGGADLLFLQQQKQIEQQQALDLQHKRAAWVQLKNDPQRAARMGIDENRMYELYQQLWPQEQAAPAAPSAAPSVPLKIQSEGVLEAMPGQTATLPPSASIAPGPAAPATAERSFRTPEQVQAAEYQRASDVEAAIKALVAKAAADPDADREPIRFLLNEQDTSGRAEMSLNDPRNRITAGELSNLLTFGHPMGGLPEWLGGPKPVAKPRRGTERTPVRDLIPQGVNPDDVAFANRLRVAR